jgi:hypothetical protein
MRDDWVREWDAELRHRHALHARTGTGALPLSIRLDLLWRAVGAVVHAFWLRKEEWSLAVIMQDVKYAVRSLSHRPAFALLAIAMLALGLGATAATFSVVRAVLLQPLPFADPDRLVQI